MSLPLCVLLIMLQCRDGRKLVVPHVVSVSGNIDRGVIAYLYNSLQQVKKAEGKQKLQQRKVKILANYASI